MSLLLAFISLFPEDHTRPFSRDWMSNLLSHRFQSVSITFITPWWWDDIPPHWSPVVEMESDCPIVRVGPFTIEVEA